MASGREHRRVGARLLAEVPIGHDNSPLASFMATPVMILELAFRGSTDAMPKA
jgi:hypothetical protein